MPVAAEDELAHLRVRRAVSRDLPAVVGLLTEAAAWARRRGIERWWPVPFPEDPVRRRIDRGETFVAEHRGKVAATLALVWADPDRWGPQPPVAGYVHSFAVARRYADRGVGRRMLEWAGDRVRREGRSRLRLDCLATNEALIAHYESLGFRRVRVVASPVPGETRGSQLLEKVVAGGGRGLRRDRPAGRGRSPRPNRRVRTRPRAGDGPDPHPLVSCGTRGWPSRAAAGHQPSAPASTASRSSAARSSGVTGFFAPRS